MTGTAELVKIAVGREKMVSGLWLAPPAPRCCLVLAHGAGAGMRHAFLEAVAAGLYAQGIATLRYQFPYMEAGSKRPDPPALCHATVRAAVAAAAQRGGAPLFAGGRSFGGRMTSQAVAAGGLPELRGLAFLGFPLHPAGAPSDARARHLFGISIPMLFLQGTRDALAELPLLQALVAQLARTATLELFDDADHSFHVRKASGTTDAQVLSRLVGTLAAWLTAPRSSVATSSALPS